MIEYLVILEKGEQCWGAYSPDVPGCIATGASREEAQHLFAEALEFHLDGLAREGLPIPPTLSEARIVRVGA